MGVTEYASSKEKNINHQAQQAESPRLADGDDTGCVSRLW